MPTKAPSSILLSSARLSTPAWLQMAPPSAANRMGVASRIPLLSNSTVKTLKNPSILRAFSFQVSTASAREPIPRPEDTLFIQLPCSNKENNKSNDGASQFPWDSQLQLKTNLRTQFKARKEDGDNEDSNRMYLSQDGRGKPIKTQPHRETGHDPAVNASDLDRTCQPRQRAADQHGANGRVITGDAAEKSKLPRLPG